MSLSSLVDITHPIAVIMNMVLHAHGLAIKLNAYSIVNYQTLRHHDVDLWSLENRGGTYGEGHRWGSEESRVRLIKRSAMISAPICRDDDDVNIASGSEIVEDTTSDRLSDELSTFIRSHVIAIVSF